MTRRFLLSYLAMTGFVVLVLAVPLGLTVARSERSQLVSAVERDATVLASLVEDTLERGRPADLDAAAVSYADRTGSRVVIVGDDGISVGDSDNPGGTPRDFSTRPEIAAALSGEIVSGDRFSQTLESGLLYVAVPVSSGGQVYGAVRITFPTATVDASIRRSWLTLAAIGAVALLAATIAGVALARSVTRPVLALHATARRLATGDLTTRAEPVKGAPELRDLATALNTMAGRLEDLLGSQRAFVADASHQLRTPLTALRLRLEGLEALAPADRADVEAAIDEVVRLSRIVDGLLTLARAETSQMSAQPIDVGAVLQERRAAWAPYAEELGIALTVDLDGAAQALVPPGVVEQILDNYLANALRVAPLGTAVVLRCRGGEDRIVVSVIDTGPGLSDAQRERAFDRFWRLATDDEDTAADGGEGFGLGLSIVRQQATAAGGSVELRTGPGGDGIEAVLTLPRAPVSRGDERSTRQASATHSPVPPADGEATRFSRPGSGTR